MKILMATDGSKEAALGLRAGARLLRRAEGNEVDVLCVFLDLSLPKLNPAESQQKAAVIREEYRGLAQKEARRIVHDAVDLLRSEGVAANAVVDMGSPARVIAGLSDQYDLTIVGASGRFDHSKLGLGPVASRVLEAARGPVLVGRELKSDPGLRILAAIDASDTSTQALRVLASFGTLAGSEITLMNVVETPWVHLGLNEDWFNLREQDEIDTGEEPPNRFERDFRHGSEDLIDKAMRILASTGASLQTVIAEGNPATEVLSEADSGDYDLIVVGASGLEDYKHTVLGSVSSKVAWSAPCSVLVARQ